MTERKHFSPGKIKKESQSSDEIIASPVTIGPRHYFFLLEHAVSEVKGKDVKIEKIASGEEAQKLPPDKKQGMAAVLHEYEVAWKISGPQEAINEVKGKREELRNMMYGRTPVDSKSHKEIIKKAQKLRKKDDLVVANLRMKRK